ncbi:hypothetical protein [Alicyclobacillus sp. ALC3]|uniref:hypothetical protein n=1 Tax=Alicyclobacillus sp. ALC3 TaxID=2796143 RepID=UPI0019D41CCE|nr:hypothetical protein [Alicyclobacillus sp. ALC3]QSO53145.1 hypothetical protein JZ785_04455 [Alicyclobacillus curvatus]WDL96485.1 hypothetical protein JC200_19540 [Alicyclobacillus sp. ALC3]
MEKKKPYPNTDDAKKEVEAKRRYPTEQYEYEKLMRQDSFRRVHRRLRQTKWADRT